MPVIQPGASIGNYQILRIIGQGGQGAVYEALHNSIGRRVALKQLLPMTAGAITPETQKSIERAFLREARLLAALDHPGLPRVTDYFAEGAEQFLVMDYIEGLTLAEALHQRGGPFPIATVRSWADQLLDVLAYLHSRTPPIIHRDIKPHNIKLGQSDRLVLLDFGLARENVVLPGVSRSLIGYTEGYAPLEQIQGQQVDERSDLYAVAATLFHMLSGRAPDGAMVRAMAAMRQQPDPLPMIEQVVPDLPRVFAAAVNRGLAMNPDDRPASAVALRSALDATTPLDPVPPTVLVGRGAAPPALTEALPTRLGPGQAGNRRPMLLSLLGLGALVAVLAGLLVGGVLPLPGGAPSPTSGASGQVAVAVAPRRTSTPTANAGATAAAVASATASAELARATGEALAETRIAQGIAATGEAQAAQATSLAQERLLAATDTAEAQAATAQVGTATAAAVAASVSGQQTQTAQAAAQGTARAQEVARATQAAAQAAQATAQAQAAQATQAALAELAALNGSWSGTTSQGQAISFRVQDGAIYDLKVVVLPDSPGDCSGITYTLSGYQSRIDAYRFGAASNFGGDQFQLSGAFASGSRAEGAISGSAAPPEGAPAGYSCVGPFNLSWSAGK